MSDSEKLQVLPSKNDSSKDAESGCGKCCYQPKDDNNNEDPNPHKKRKLSSLDSSKSVGKDDEVVATTKEKISNIGNSNKAKKPKKKKHLDQELLKLRRTIQLCCASDDFHTAIEAYLITHVKQNVKMEPQSFYNLLNLCAGGLGERGIHIGTPKPDRTCNTMMGPKGGDDQTSDVVGNKCETKSNNSKDESKSYSPKERKEFAHKIKNEMDELGISLNETAFTALIRLLCQQENNDLDEAERMLDQAEKTQQCKPKLRMYGCLIDAFCNELNNNLAGALRVWKRMNNLERKDKNGNMQNAIMLTEKEYCIMMKCATRIGDRGVMGRVLQEVAEDVLVPSLNTKDTIVAWYQSEHAISYDENSTERESALTSNTDLQESSAPSMGPVHYQCKKAENEHLHKWRVTSGDTIDSKSGILQTGCLKGQALKPVQLNRDSWRKMLEMNEDIVVKGEVAALGKIPSSFAGGGKGKKRVVTEEEMGKRIKQWEAFKAFLNKRVGPPFYSAESNLKSTEERKRFDVVVDGANVGYYQRNFANAPKHVDYKQIDWVVEHFQKEDKNVLLFMHVRHFNKNLMPQWAEPIMKKWEEAGVLYKTPYGANDDWFWMHTALWCGRGTMVLSNDLMRDHHFQMLAHRSFLRWKERHQVYFDFGGWMGQQREVILTYPDTYSRRIQCIPGHGLVIPLPQRGDINRFLDGQFEADETAPSHETYVSIATPLLLD